MQLAALFTRIFLLYLMHLGIHYCSSMLVDSENNRNIPSHERQALYDLYLSTNGDDWTYQDGDLGHWNFTDPDVNPCSSSDPWQGLNCNINRIWLHSNYVRWTIISELYQIVVYLTLRFTW